MFITVPASLLNAGTVIVAIPAVPLAPCSVLLVAGALLFVTAGIIVVAARWPRWRARRSRRRLRVLRPARYPLIR